MCHEKVSPLQMDVLFRGQVIRLQESCFDGRVVIGERIGSGAFGVVYHTRVNGSDGYVTKLIPIAEYYTEPSPDSDESEYDEPLHNPPDPLENVQREILMTREAERLGVGAPIYHAEICDGWGVIVMMALHTSLDDFLYNDTLQTEENVITVRRLLSEMREKCSIAKFFHGDLHSENVMMTVFGGRIINLYLIDFGMSRFITRDPSSVIDDEWMELFTSLNDFI